MNLQEIIAETIHLTNIANAARLLAIVGTGLPPVNRPPKLPEEINLWCFLANQSKDILNKIVSVVYLGRGDFPANELETNIAQYDVSFSEPTMIIDLLVSKWCLGEFLERGLAKLKENKCQ